MMIVVPVSHLRKCIKEIQTGVVANKTYHKKNQEKLRVYLAKIEKHVDVKRISEKDHGNRGRTQNDKNDVLRQRF